MKVVVGPTFAAICNQASLQTRQPLPGGGRVRRPHSWATGSWACARGVGEEFSLADATADYKKMVTDFDDAGPLTRAAFMAQAYGVAVAPELGRFPASSACPPPARATPGTGVRGFSPFDLV